MNKPDAAELPTPTAPIAETKVMLGGEENVENNKKKVRGLKQLRLDTSKSVGLSSDAKTGLN